MSTTGVIVGRACNPDNEEKYLNPTSHTTERHCFYIPSDDSQLGTNESVSDEMAGQFSIKPIAQNPRGPLSDTSKSQPICYSGQTRREP